MRAVRLEEMVRRCQITRGQAEAGSQWLGDWLEGERSQGARRGPLPDRTCGFTGGRGDIMTAAVRDRLRKAEAALDGRTSQAFRVAKSVVIDDRPAADAAAALDLKHATVMDLLRMALKRLMAVYRVNGEAGLTG